MIALAAPISVYPLKSLQSFFTTIKSLVAFIESEERLRMTSVSRDSRDSQGQEIRFVALSHVCEFMIDSRPRET
jgi:hypothetical protein